MSDSRGFVENGPLPKGMNPQLEWCYSSYTAVYAWVIQSSFAPELYGQMKMVMTSPPCGGGRRCDEQVEERHCRGQAQTGSRKGEAAGQAEGVKRSMF